MRVGAVTTIVADHDARNAASRPTATASHLIIDLSAVEHADAAAWRCW